MVPFMELPTAIVHVELFSLLWSQQNIIMCPRLKSAYYTCSLMSFFLPCLHSFCTTLSVAEKFSFSTSDYFRWNCENRTIIYDKLIEANNRSLRNAHTYGLNRLPLNFKLWYLYHFVTSPILLIKILHIRKIQIFLSWSILVTMLRILYMNYYRVTSFKFSVRLTSFMS